MKMENEDVKTKPERAFSTTIFPTGFLSVRFHGDNRSKQPTPLLKREGLSHPQTHRHPQLCTKSPIS